MKKVIHTSVSLPSIDSAEVHFDPAPTDEKKRLIVGTGGFGVVYGATYRGKPVAIKTLHSTTPQMIDVLKKEALTMYRIQSPHTVSLLGMMEHDGAVSLVVERLENSLFKKIHQEEPMSWQERYRLAHEIAVGLWTLHQQNIVHSNLKSQNILLDTWGHAKITDIGFSKFNAQFTLLFSSEHARITAAYQAPELCACDLEDSDSDDEETHAPYTPYSDIYAFGVVLWELACRAIPFEGKSLTKIHTRIVQGKTQPIPDDCPEDFAQLIRDCWLMPPNQRPQTAELVARTQAFEETQFRPVVI